ncbi:actin-binding protein WASF1-like [Hoplias malabaricus]|uniref:actin-binding protein WASF1-like n=1 Tax=Hoplias malabaricus TaxID=27720 RepID=UPI003462A0A2
MPFSKRAVEPVRLARSRARRAEKCEVGKVDSPLKSWSSLSDVSCTAIRNALVQLSDLSRHAASIFLEIHSEVSSVVTRSTALQRRLDSLQDTVRKLDHKKITIRKWSRLDCVALGT